MKSPCLYRLNQGYQFYDEQHSKLLPWLLPDLLICLGSGFSEEKTKFKEEAKIQAAKLAEGVVNNILSEVENLARHTLLALTKAWEWESSH